MLIDGMTGASERVNSGFHPKRVTVIAGHYGSGKTQIAVHLARKLRKSHEHVTLCDLDIVNPYFRTIDCREALEREGVRVISSEYAGSNVETPGMPPEAVSVFDDERVFSVIDVGGDDRGALALGRYSERLQSGADILLVVNRFRPLSSGAEDTCGLCREIENAARIRFTGIVNNSNLGAQTTANDILSSLPYAEEIGKKLSLPVVAVSMKASLAKDIEIETIWAMEIFQKPGWVL